MYKFIIENRRSEWKSKEISDPKINLSGYTNNDTMNRKEIEFTSFTHTHTRTHIEVYAEVGGR